MNMNNPDITELTFSLETQVDRELALARLIDDELTAAQERELLKHLDAHPELWRHCALGFLEERAMRRGARGWIKSQEPAPLSMSLAPPASSLVGAKESLAEPETPPVNSRPESVLPARSSSPKRRTWLDSMTLAAGLLLAFTVGLIVQQNQSRPLPNNMPVAKDQAPASAPSTAAQPITLAKDDSPSNLRLQYVSHEGQPSNKEIDVPLIPVSDVDDSMLASWEQATRQNTIPKETQRWLEQEGQVVRQQNMWLTVDLPNGQQALVPVQRIYVQPRHLLAQ
jgi:hypothetical protein